MIQFCRYYNGEEKCPYKNGDETMLWHVERSWVADTFVSLNVGDVGNLGSELDEYIGCGLSTFRQDDSIPATLKARLFNRFAKNCYSMSDATSPFKKFYARYY